MTRTSQVKQKNIESAIDPENKKMWLLEYFTGCISFFEIGNFSNNQVL